MTLLIREALKHPAVQCVEDFEEKVGMFITVTDGFWTLDYLYCSQNNVFFVYGDLINQWENYNTPCWQHDHDY